MASETAESWYLRVKEQKINQLFYDRYWSVSFLAIIYRRLRFIVFATNYAELSYSVDIAALSSYANYKAATMIGRCLLPDMQQKVS